MHVHLSFGLLWVSDGEERGGEGIVVVGLGWGLHGDWGLRKWMSMVCLYCLNT